MRFKLSDFMIMQRGKVVPAMREQTKYIGLNEYKTGLWNYMYTVNTCVVVNFDISQSQFLNVNLIDLW